MRIWRDGIRGLIRRARLDESESESLGIAPDLSARAKNKVGNAQTHLTEVTRVNFQNKEVEK